MRLTSDDIKRAFAEPLCHAVYKQGDQIVDCSMNYRGFFAITRPLNSVVSGLAAVLAYLIATGTITLFSLILVAAVTLITAAGNVINDYFDADIDAVNRPERPIPSGAVNRSSALSYAAILFACGILVSLFTNPLCLGIAVFNSLLLAGYAARLKSRPLVGNITVSYLSASIFLFGGALAGTGGLVENLPLAVITFFAMVARELLKDAEDVSGDAAGGARTLPLQIGIRDTGRLAFAFAVLAVCSSIIPFFRWGIPYLAGIGIVDLIILVAAFRALPCTTPACVKASLATALLKAGFFASLAVFLLAAVLL
jgi:geranylgeranylglycerol-phosphate geranylgeranyltransferase